MAEYQLSIVVEFSDEKKETSDEDALTFADQAKRTLDRFFPKAKTRIRVFRLVKLERWEPVDPPKPASSLSRLLW